MCLSSHTALLNAINVMMIYNRLKNDSAYYDAFQPTTFLFGGKAAPGYVNAKLIIKFINNISKVISSDSSVRDKLAVYFMPNYSVTMAETIIPAANISEQISTAGNEASGTGNMKFMANGALTVGTLDGANVEMAEEVGRDNIFIFGHTEEEISAMQPTYSPYEWLAKDPELQSVFSLLDSGYLSVNEPHIFEPLRKSLFDYGDRYFLLADLRMYHDVHETAQELYKANQAEWNRKALINVAGSAKFSSDRTIRQYAEEIWDIKPCKVRKSSTDSVLEDARKMQ